MEQISEDDLIGSRPRQRHRGKYQCYLIAWSPAPPDRSEPYVVIAKKRLSARRSRDADGTRGAGYPIANAPGKPCLPGGAGEPLETVGAAALREFHEETGIDLATDAGSYGVTHVFKQDAGRSGYCGVFVSVNNISELVQRIRTNLVASTNHDDELDDVAYLPLSEAIAHIEYADAGARELDWYVDILRTAQTAL